VIPIVALMLVLMLFMSFEMPESITPQLQEQVIDEFDRIPQSKFADTMSGVLEPVVIEHTGSASGPTHYEPGRTDYGVDPMYQVWLPSGSPENDYSSDCTGGSFLVGPSGLTDFGSPAGTISLWIKWDGTAPNGRFWGQDFNFETRWSSSRLTLDWGSDSTLQGIKDDWVQNHWYFIAIVWNENTNLLGLYWGDEQTEPEVDLVSTSWTDTVFGLLAENDIMNSAARSAQVNGHVDEFRYFDVQRSQEDLADDYRRPLEGNEHGLQHYYEFDGDLKDSAGSVDLVVSGSHSYSRDVFSEENGWKAEQIEIGVQNLKELYALNGTFETGMPGVNQDWIGDGQYYASGWRARREILSTLGRQRASYIDSDPLYVVLENEGYAVSAPAGYRHYNGTKIYWYQTVNNSKEVEDFVFSLDYLYQHGPIGSNHAGIFSFKFEVLDGLIPLWEWSIDPVNITNRGEWYSLNNTAVHIPGVPSSFQLRISLEVNVSSSYLEISESDPDISGDPANAMFVTFWIDEVSLTAAESLDYEAVDLRVQLPSVGDLPIVGSSGSGISIANYSYWTRTEIPISLSSNTTVSFECTTRVSRMTRFLNSSYTTVLNEHGVAYAASYNTQVNLTLLTYVPSYPGAENMGFRVNHPKDWENSSVFDPFDSDLTNQIESGVGIIELPMGLVDSVGWWIVTMQGPNYAKEVTAQKFISSGSNWIDNKVFRSGDQIRCQVTIGTAFDFPSQVMNLETILFLPSNEFWATAYMNNGTGFMLTSEIFTFGSYNATIGEWMATAFWNNGSAVAYGHVHFEVHHPLTMFAHTPSIERNLGENFTAAVYIHDQETGEPILSGDAIVSGNWSGGPASFSPNFAKGWWESDFNTSHIGVGIWVMEIHASIPYFDNANCTIDIQVMTFTVMTTLGNYYVEISPGGTYEAKFRYMFLDGTGIANADVFVATWSGPDQGIEYEDTNPVPGEPGNYTIEFTGSTGGTYFITVSGFKEDHSTAATSFYLIVGAISTDLVVSGEELPDELYYNQTYTCTLYYSDGGSVGIEGASINISYNPVAIVNWVDNGGGFYQFSIRVPSVGSFAVYVRFQQFGYAFDDTSFIFDVVEVPTSISGYGISESYYESRTYEFSLYYNSTLESGIQGATLTPSVSIRAFYRFMGSGNGWYNFSLTPASGNYNATLWLTRSGYQEQEFSFRLSVVSIPVILSPYYPLNATYSKLAGSVLMIRISPIAADTGHVLTGATVEYVVENAYGNGNDYRNSDLFVEAFGVYTANITVPHLPGLYMLRITILKDSFQPVQNEIVLSSEENPGVVLARNLQAGMLGALALLGVISVTMLTRRYYHMSTTRRNLELLAQKGRLDDARNLIGLLIIHRKVGLPVYSRILKGGFEEAMLSSFIAAISQFRAEFSWDEPIWAAIPITEVITAVQTEALICAIVTLEGSSAKQKSQLETFGRDVGGLYDHEDDTLRSMFHTPELSQAFAKTLDPVFDSYFDGALMVRYVGVKKGLPSHLKPVAEAMASLKIDYGVTPDAIIKAMVLHEYSEHVAHSLTLEAIDDEYLIASERKLPPPASDEVL
jgi:hypothetical protein